LEGPKQHQDVLDFYVKPVHMSVIGILFVVAKDGI